MALHRYRVRPGHKTWNDEGPDMLRPLDNAVQAARGLMLAHQGEGPFTVEVDKQELEQPLFRRQVMEVIERGDYESVRVILGKVVLLAVKHEYVTKLPVSNCSVAVSVLWSLIKHQFPNIVFSGGYVLKETFPGYWSDHSWGDAFDATQKLPLVVNDEVFSWLVRSAKTGCIKFDYALGSRNGKVVASTAPDYDVFVSNASDSHLWHCHISVRDHDGDRPPVRGG